MLISDVSGSKSAAAPMVSLDTPGAHLISKQALIEGVRAHAQRVLEREVRGKGCEPLPQGLGALMLHNLLSAVDDACSIADPPQSAALARHT